MRMNLKKVAVSALAVMAALAMTVPAYAKDEGKINSVTIRVNSKPQAGDSIGDPDLSIKTPSSNVEIYDAEYDNDDSEWERGDTPIIYATIRAKGDRYFSHTELKMSKPAYTVSKSKGKNGESEWEVKIKLTKIEGDLDTVEDLHWSGRTAKWEEVNDASKYEVKLYRNSSTVTTVTTTGTSYNFYPYMTKSGDYTFKVRAVDGSDKGEWSDESDEYYMNSSDVYTGTPPTDNSSNSSSGGSTPANANGQWVNSIYGWSYYINGVPVKNNWVYVDNEWYHLNANGFMDTDWIYTDNNWFYLNPVSDGTRGKMLTGWQQIGPYKYYLNPVSDGTRGARKTGYQFIDGAWYLFDLNSGALWTNMVTPNGMVADANGVLH